MLVYLLLVDAALGLLIHLVLIAPSGLGSQVSLPSFGCCFLLPPLKCFVMALCACVRACVRACVCVCV